MGVNINKCIPCFLHSPHFILHGHVRLDEWVVQPNEKVWKTRSTCMEGVQFNRVGSEFHTAAFK
jgi:hypothetical protein